jgi:hypothetical protein
MPPPAENFFYSLSKVARNVKEFCQSSFVDERPTGEQKNFPVEAL